MAEKNLEALNGKELEIYNIEFERLLNIYLPERDLIHVFMKHKGWILEECQAAKSDLGVPFGGFHCAQSEFGWQFIRPQHVRTSTNYNWQKTVAAGWNDQFGASGSEVQINDLARMSVIALFNYAANPLVIAERFNVMGNQRNIYNVDAAFRSTLPLYDLPKPFGVARKKSFYSRSQAEVAGTDETALLGITFGTGDYLTMEAATTQSGGT